MGTLKLDIISKLAHGRFDSDGDTYELTDIEVRLGGTAAHFAKAAQGKFDRVSIIAASASDALASILEGQLANVCDEVRMQSCADSPSAVVINLRDAPDAAGRTRRILLSSRCSPHMMLSADHIEACAETIQRSDIFLADGYFLQGDKSRGALTTAMRIARRNNVYTLFDLVPHSLPESIPADVVIPVLGHADVIVAEARTVIGLNEARWPVDVLDNIELMARTQTAARRLAESAIWILRYGFENMENTVIMADGRPLTDYCTLYRYAPQKAGFGDIQLVHELRSILLDGQAILRDLTTRRSASP